MSNKLNWKEDKYILIFLGIMISFLIFLITIPITHSYDETTIIGKVTDTVFKTGYMLITFNNDTIVKINYPHFDNYIDLTVHSKLYVKLHKGFMWFDIWSDRTIWNIDYIIKVPTEV